MGNEKPSVKLRIIQNELMKAAAEVEGENINGKAENGGGDVDRYNYGEERELNKEERLRERKRHHIFEW
eukprot:4582799-Pleurochrysis_carterae.AAC.1